ncbi:hypothetical protein Pelo_19541 [Pelomyxa schiedti]|nr:hypothetical protein Pelo_19541 [Pelomyxa schiedti]
MPANLGNILVMQNKAAQDVIVVHFVNEYGPTSIVLVVHSGGAVTQLYGTSEIECIDSYQISSSMFSIHFTDKGKLDIWDCNEITKSHPVSRSIHEIPYSRLLLGGGFLILLADSRNRQVITEASSGIIALSFGIDGWRFDELVNTTSFLC